MLPEIKFDYSQHDIRLDLYQGRFRTKVQQLTPCQVRTCAIPHRSHYNQLPPEKPVTIASNRQQNYGVLTIARRSAFAGRVGCGRPAVQLHP